MIRVFLFGFLNRDTSDHLNFLMCQREPSPCADDEGHPALSECNYGTLSSLSQAAV